MNENDIENIGRNLFYKSTKTNSVDEYNAAYFTAITAASHEAEIIANCKNIIHTMLPLNLDIASSNTYLLSGVDMRLRFELAPASLLINTSTDNHYRYKIQTAKIWVKKIVPQPSALLSLNKSLVMKNMPIEYIFDRPIVKNIIFPAQHTNITIDNIFSGIIPNQLFVFMIEQTALNGSYKRNGAYFAHNDIRNARLEINGNTVI